MNEYEKEKQILVGQEMAEKYLKKDAEKVCDWQNEEEVSIMRSDKREAERKVLLDSIVPTRVCPCCRRRIWLDGSWVIEERVAICRSCFHSRSSNIDTGRITGSFIKDTIIRFEVDGWKIRSLRKRLGIGPEAFAERMGYTKMYQMQIETNKMRSLSIDTVEKLISVFNSLGADIRDSV